MLSVKNKRYVKKYRYGGAGIFDTISNFFKRLISSKASKSIASNLSRAAASDIGKKAIGTAKTVGKELATSAISTAKDVAIDEGKSLIDKASTKVLTPKNVEVIKTITGLDPYPPVINQKSKDILTALGNAGATTGLTNIDNLMQGNGIKKTIKSKGTNAIRI